MIDPRGRIEIVASRDASRPVLAEPYLRIREHKTGRGRNRKTHRTGYLIATDSYRLARIPVTLEDDATEGVIPKEVILFARAKGGLIQATGDRLFVVNETTGKEIASFPRPENASAFPDEEKLMSNGETAAPIVSVGLNAELLAGLADALGGKQMGVRIDIYHPLRAMRVSPLGGSEGEGILMPIRLADSPDAA